MQFSASRSPRIRPRDTSQHQTALAIPHYPSCHKALEHGIDSPRLCYCKRAWSLRRKKIVDTLHRDKLVLFPLIMLSFRLSHRFGDVCQGFTLTMCCSWIRMTLCVKQWLSDHHPTMGSNARFPKSRPCVNIVSLALFP